MSSTTTVQNPVKSPQDSMPEGVEFVGYKAGPPTPEEYEIVNVPQFDIRNYEVNAGRAVIFKGPRPGASSGVIVKPLAGYAFVRSTVGDGSYSVTKLLNPPLTIKRTVTFTATTSQQEQGATAALEALNKLPGFVSAE